ncbi:pilus assembly protein HicB [Nocardioides sp.]|uniref:pilus assembly protein HicB n=1 Tax=Nocardioides sp. TaxID=35761 RepID=UPI003784BC25
MDITPYVDALRRDLVAAADAVGPEAGELTERLGFALDPAARLALMEAVSQAAAEITAEMRDGAVDVRLDGRELAFVVHEAPVPAAAAAPAQPADEETEDDGTVARITLRIPESVKTRAEELAARSGSSLNTWLVNVVRAATREGAVNVDIDLSSIPFLGGGPDPFTAKRGNRRMTGWV